MTQRKDVPSIRDLFEREIRDHSPHLKSLALHVYDAALKYGYPCVRESKADTNDGETIFKHDETHVFFLVINTKKRRIKLVTEDKTGFIDASAFGLEPMKRTQGERKKGLQVYLDDKFDDVYRDIVTDLIKQCAYSNKAYQDAKGSSNSTDYFTVMFGEPTQPGAPWWRALTNETFASAISHADRKCVRCKAERDLELSSTTTGFEIVCKNCNPLPSRFSGISDLTIPFDVRRLVWHRDGGRCHVTGCRSVRDNLQFDHVIPRSHGGSNTEHNLILKCRSHNLRKGNKLLVWC